GHHPTEVDKTLRALREHERPERRDGRLVCVFQPHQHSRTRFLLEEFATSFGQADVVIVPHIYFVRDSEAERAKVSAADLVDRLRRRGIRAMHLYPFEAIVEHLENVCRPGAVLVTMGAGPVTRIAEAYLALGGGAGAGGGARAWRRRRGGSGAMHLYPFEATVEHLETVCRPGDVRGTMGAGPVNRIAEAYLALGGGAGAGGGA